eukprot:1549810-Amphidinium_carterae.1
MMRSNLSQSPTRFLSESLTQHNPVTLAQREQKRLRLHCTLTEIATRLESSLPSNLQTPHPKAKNSRQGKAIAPPEQNLDTI